MFETDEASPFVGGPTQAPFLKRSISAPAIAEHDNHGEGDGMYYNGNAPSRMNPRIPIKRTNIHGDEGNEDANLESYDSDKFLATEAGDHDEGAAGEDDNSSLWIDPRKTPGPMDRIQEDFPSTPSAVYSKRLLANAEGRFDQDIGEDEDNLGEDPLLAAATSAHHQQQSPSPRSSSSFLTQSAAQPNSPARHNVGRTASDESGKSQTGGSGSNGASQKFHASDPSLVDHVALSLSNLYVSDDDMVNGGMRAARSTSNLLSTQNGPSGSITTTTSVTSLIQNPPAQQSLLQPLSLQVPVRAGSPRGMAVPAPMHTLSANSQAYTGALPALHQIGGISHIMEQQQQLHQHAPSQQLQGQAQGSQGQGHQSLYRPQQHQQQLMGMTQVQQQQMMQGGVQYLAMPQGAEGGAATLTGPNGQQQPAYYVQQPVYLDQNGQPVYYRVANQAGQYQQQDGQMIYGVPGQQEGGNPLGDPLQVSYIPYNPTQSQNMGNQTAYWAHQGQDAQGQPVYMTAGPGGMAVQGQTVDANGMVRRVAYGNVPPQQQYVMANGGQIPSGTHRGQGQQVGMVQGQGQYMNGMMPSQGGLGANGMMSGQMAQMGGRAGDLDNGMFQVNPRGDQNMGSRPVDIRDRVDVRNGNKQDVGGINNNNNNNMNRNQGGGGNGGDRGGDREFRREDRRDDRLRDDRREDRGNDRRDRDRDRDRDGRDRDGRDKRDREREWGDRDRGGYSRNSNSNSSAGANPVRDALVDEFRSTYGKSRQWGLCDLLGHVVAFCQDQHGSRFIQQRLEVCSDVDKQLIFDEIIPSAHLLMTDVFGNYVLQKLFEYGTPDQCEALALLLSGQSVQLAMQMYGCRVVQKALEYVSTQRLIALVSEFENPPVLLRCVHDSNGNHVIQKCIEIVSRVAKEASTPELSEFLSSRIQFIIDAFQGRVKELSSHPYGCRVVQRILEHCSNPQKSVILEELRQCCAELVQDCYGNYVIQFVMQHGWEADRAVLIREVQTNLLDFSQHKFASNVVEKCLQYASKRDRDEMIWTIINVTFDLKNPVDAKTGHCVLESMVRDPYANYVVQKVIDVSDERQRGAIMRYVKENIVQLRRYTYGKHIIVRLEKITNEKF